MKKELAVILVVVMFAAGCGKNSKKDDSKKTEEKPAKVVILEKKEIVKEVQGNGEAEPIQDSSVVTETGGYIKDIKVRNGQFVKKGEILLIMSDAGTEQNYMNAYANYMSAKSNLEKAKKFSEKEYKNSEVRARESYNAAKRAYDKAKRGAEKEDLEKARLSVEMEAKNFEFIKQTHEKNIKLYEKELISQQEFLNSETQYKNSENSYKIAKESLSRMEKGSAQEDLDQLKSNVENTKSSYELAKKYSEDSAWKYDIQGAESAYLSAEAAYKYAKERYDDLKVKAPVTGEVSDLTVKVGERLDKETTFFSIVNTSSIKFEVGITGKELENIKQGSKASVYVEDINQTFEGEVYEINPVADKESKKFKVKVKVENSDNKIKKRMYGKIKISGEKYEGIMVPSESLVIQNLYSYIFIVDQNGKVNKTAVKTGFTQGNYQEILSDDIKAGTKVVVEGQFLLQDGDIIKEVK